MRHGVGKARSSAARRAQKLANRIRIAVWATSNVNLSCFDLMRADKHLAGLKSSPREARAVLKHVHNGLVGDGGARWPVRSPWGADLMKLACCKHHQHQSSGGSIILVFDYIDYKKAKLRPNRVRTFQALSWACPYKGIYPGHNTPRNHTPLHLHRSPTRVFCRMH